MWGTWCVGSGWEGWGWEERREGGEGGGGGKGGLPLGLWSSRQTGVKDDSFSSSLVSVIDGFIQNRFIQ